MRRNRFRARGYKSRRRGTKKPEHLERHAARRAFERYGIWLSREDFKEIIASIQSHAPEAEFIERQSFNRTIWRVTFNDLKILLVYDQKRQAIATALPPTAYTKVASKHDKCQLCENQWPQLVCICKSTYCENCIRKHWQTTHPSEMLPEELAVPDEQESEIEEDKDEASSY